MWVLLGTLGTLVVVGIAWWQPLKGEITSSDQCGSNLQQRQKAPATSTFTSASAAETTTLAQATTDSLWFSPQLI